MPPKKKAPPPPSQQHCLLLMTKNPALGKVKTRLAKSIGDEKALEIYLRLLRHTHKITVTLPVHKKVFYTEFIPENDLWEGYQKHLQCKGDLGQKMKDAFQVAFDEGYQKIIIIGGDCAELTEEIIGKAFLHLEKSPVTIGPAQDGGYYLLGMNSMIERLFQDKKWSTSEVLPETLKDLEALKIKPILLPTLNDVDEWKDLPEDWK